MTNDWPVIRFGELCDHSAFGPRFSSDEYSATGNVACLRTMDITANGEIDLKAMPLAQLDANRFNQHFLQLDDLVITRTGAYLGKVAVFEGFKLPVLAGAFLIRFQLNTGALRPHYARYYFNSPTGQQQIQSIVTGSVQPNLNITNLHTLEIPVPPLVVQERIIDIVKSLDDKIELNRRMNETLEAMARRLFKSWFVDFDPVHAKAALRREHPKLSNIDISRYALPNMAPEIAELFPDSFEDSTLGPIPKGWKVDLLKNRTSNVQYGFTQSSSSDPIGPRFLRITDIQGGKVDWQSVPFCLATDEETVKYRVVDCDIFIARTGASTGENIFIIDPPIAVFASYLVRLQFHSRGIARVVGAFLRSDRYFDFVAGSIGGSAQPNASAQTLASAEMVFPHEGVADAFHSLVMPGDLHRRASEKENSCLIATRDTLLPRLLSGDLQALPAGALS